MSGIVWEEPAPDGRGQYRRRWDDILDELRENPGRWARLATYDKQGSAARLAYRIRTGVPRGARPAGSFEAVSRAGTSGSEFAVYARYVGATEAGS